MGAPDISSVERFRPTSGRVTGGLTLIVAAVVAAYGLVNLDAGFPAWVLCLAVLFALLAWAASLRPALWATSDELVMRNMFETVRVPLAAIEELAIRQFVAIRVGERRFVSPVIGRSWRKLVKGSDRAETASTKPRTEMHYADFVEERLRHLMAEARTRQGIAPWSDEQAALATDVRREPAWVPIALIAAGALAVVVGLVV